MSSTRSMSEALESLDARIDNRTANLEETMATLKRLTGNVMALRNEEFVKEEEIVKRSEEAVDEFCANNQEASSDISEEIGLDRMKAEVKELRRMIMQSVAEVRELRFGMKRKEEEWLKEKLHLQEQINEFKREMKSWSKVQVRPIAVEEDPNQAVKIIQASCEEEKVAKRIVNLETAVNKLRENENELRRVRRKNVIVTNFPDVGVSRVDEKAQSLFRDVLQVGVKVLGAEVISRNVDGGNVVRVNLQSVRDKLEVMRNKHKMSRITRRMFINDDLTREERSLQKEIRVRVNEERQKGHNWREGYQKVNVNGTWIPWEKLK